MRLVVTGALGHIGSQLIRDLPLLIPDVELLLVDDLSTQRYCSLFGLPDEGHYRFVEADVLTADLRQLFDGADVVIHLAAVTNAAASFDIQEHVERVNFEGTRRVAFVCADIGARLAFLSTTSVYGTANTVVDEACPVSDLKPQSPYAASKLRAEQFLQSLGRDHRLGFVICRFGTIFGTSVGMRFHTAINKFCWQATMGLPLTVWRTALNQRRPYLDLGDACRALIHIIRTDLFDNEIYNVLTMNASIGEIVDTIRSYISDVRVELVDSPIMNQLSYDVSDAKFATKGFATSGSLDAGICNTLQLLAAAAGRKLVVGSRA